MKHIYLLFCIFLNTSLLASSSKYSNFDFKLNDAPTCNQFGQKFYFKTLISHSYKVLAKSDNGFITTDFGYKIDLKCINHLGADFSSLLKSTMNEGYQCLIELDKVRKDKSKKSAALINHNNFKKFLSKNSVSITCSEENYPWENNIAHISSEDLAKKDRLNVKHPYLSINPDFVQKIKLTNSDQRTELKKTLFHEQLHYLGFKHDESIEFPYACEECCFSDKEENKSLREASCRICTGEYKDNLDINYLEDYTSFTYEYYGDSLKATELLIQYIKKSPSDLDAAILLATSLSGDYSSLGFHLAELIKIQNKKLSKRALRYLSKLKRPESKLTDPAAKVLAQVYLKLYVEKKPLKAINLLEKHKLSLKSKIKQSSPKEYAYEELKSSLFILLGDLWTRDFDESLSEEDIGSRAFESLDFFEEALPVMNTNGP